MPASKLNKTLYQERLNVIKDYIHSHLDSTIDIKTLAEMSHFSPYHFHRITKALLGESIGKYILRIRLESAAKQLRYTNDSVEDIAYQVGYDTPSSLSKAFKNHFKISPINYRKNQNYQLKKQNSMKTTLQIKKPKITTVDSKNCIYYSMKGAYHTLDYSNAWQLLWAEVKSQKLFTAGIEHIGIPYDDPNVTADEHMRYDACLVIHKNASPSGAIGIKTLESGRFAIFHYQGAYLNLPDVYDYIFNDWLMQTDYQLRDVPVREKYLNNPERTESHKLKTEIYIPIK